MQTRKVTILPYDPSCEKAFEDIKSEIEAALGKLIIAVEHVGSTAVKE